MRYIVKIILAGVVLINFLSAQVVTTAPSYATEQDSIVIYFHADRGDKGLQGYTGDVYAHTGVITNYSTDAHDWKHVIAAWDENLAKAKLERMDTDLYKLVLGYPRIYYGLTDSGEKILKLAFVFRNADGSQTGRDEGGADIFYTLYEPGITSVIINPAVDIKYGNAQRSPVFMNPGDTLSFISTAAAIGVTADSIVLKVNGQKTAVTSGDTLSYLFRPDANQQGNNWLTSIAYGSGGLIDSQSVFIMVNAPPDLSALPAGEKDGINYDSDTQVTLSLFAPHKKFVYVIGDFNDWKIDQAFQMHKDSVDRDTTHYWITLTGLTPGEEYAFQYLVDGEIRIADPYTDKVLDPWNDSAIKPATYPNLKPYPSGKTDYIVSTFQTAQEPFEWQATSYQRPLSRDLVIYELLIRDFVAKHDYKTLIDSLDYLQNLGVNAIELMPINEFEGNESWGYNPSFYFAPDKYYGPKNDLKRFIDACHQRGIAVILDMVLNHSTGQSPFVRLYNEGIYGKPTPQNPWYNVESPNPTYNWFYDFNHESKATQNLVDRINRYWLTQYKVDGFRFDFTKGFTNKPGDGGAYDASRIHILERMADRIWQTDPAAYVILEHFTDNSEETVLADYGMMLWGNMNYNYNEATMGYHDNNKSDFSWGFYKERGWSLPGLVTYMESHDEERLMYKNLQYGNSNGAYNIKELPTALNRMKMAAAFFFTLPGPKMIWQFGELGYDYSIEYNGRVGNKPIRWDYLQDAKRKLLYKTFAALIHLRAENEAFRSPYSSVEQTLAGVVKRIKISYATLNASIVGNFGVGALSIDPSFQHAGDWYDYFTGDTLIINDVHAAIALHAGEFHIYTDQKLTTPDEDLINALPFSTTGPVKTFSLSQNYPNPFGDGRAASGNNRYTVITYRLPRFCRVQLTVFNSLGQKVRTIVDRNQPRGKYHVKFDARGLASGIYFYQLQVGGQVRIRKMLLLH